MLAGLIAATKIAFSGLDLMVGRDETQLLELTPDLFAWLSSLAAQPLCRPHITWRAVCLRAMDGSNRLEWPCKVPEHSYCFVTAM